ncbi:hypothetical protein [Olsenella massiliensis]|uniref:hypothetical protein n=1 Tax=Olsenella massiliensis TaxID=1622075 RepID=UPI00071E5BE0|nr:hypothetical protein [Olsenella massiliensis]
MSERVANELRLMIEEAEQEERCLVADSQRDRLRLCRLVRQDRMTSPLRGLYCPTELWDRLNPAQRCRRIVRALARQHPYLTFCHVTAALIWDLPVSWQLLGQVHALRSTGGRRQGPTSSIRWHQRSDAQVTTHDGVRVTSLDQTVVDCLCSLDFTEGLVVADGYLRRTGTTRRQLQNLLKDLGHGVKGVPQARLTASFADGRSESGGESALRATIVKLGFPVPTPQLVIKDPIDPSRSFRLDLVVRNAAGVLVDIELDGRDKYLDPNLTGGADPEEVRRAERLRESRVTAYGIEVARFSGSDARDAARVGRVLAAFGVAKGIPPQTQARNRTRGRARGLRWRQLRLGPHELWYKVIDMRRRRRSRAGRRLPFQQSEVVCP